MGDPVSFGTYQDIIYKLGDIERILEGCENRDERMYPNFYKPIKERLKNITDKVSAISEF